MTTVDKVIALLHEHGAANATFDPSATDGSCWSVEQKDHWYRELAEDIVNACQPPGQAAPTWVFPAAPDRPVRDIHGVRWSPTDVPSEWMTESRLCTTWVILLADRGPLTEEK